MKSGLDSPRKLQAKPKAAVKPSKAVKGSMHPSTQNPNRSQTIIKAVYAGHVRGGHAFH